MGFQTQIQTPGAPDWAAESLNSTHIGPFGALLNIGHHGSGSRRYGFLSAQSRTCAVILMDKGLALSLLVHVPNVWVFRVWGNSNCNTDFGQVYDYWVHELLGFLSLQKRPSGQKPNILLTSEPPDMCAGAQLQLKEQLRADDTWLGLNELSYSSASQKYC